MPTTKLASIRTPESLALNDLAAQFKDLAEQIEKLTPVRFADYLQRAAVFTANPTIAVPLGFISHRLDWNVFEFYNGAGLPSVATSWTMLTPYRKAKLLTASAATVVFTLPTLPFPLQRCSIRWVARSDAGGFAAQACRIRINGDTGNNYNTQYTQGAAAGVTAAAQTAAAFANVGLQPVAAALAGTFGTGNINFAGLDAPSGHTSILPWTFDNTIQTPATGQWVQQGGGTWNGAAPYTTITIFPEAGNWIAGSQFSLEGWELGLP